MPIYADVEISLKQAEGGYRAEVRYTPPNSDSEVHLLPGDSARLNFDFEALNRLNDDSSAYAQILGESLWSEPLLAAFRTARTTAQATNATLRMRLFLDHDCPKLHDLHWEKLRDPDKPGTDVSLFTDQTLLFSRYLSSDDLRPIDMRPMRDRKALVVIANPRGLGSTVALAAIDVEGELLRVAVGLGTIREEQAQKLKDDKANLGTILEELARASESAKLEKRIPLETLCSDPNKPGIATLNKIATKLGEGYDILYLVCHGAFTDEQARLFLEDDKGNIAGEWGAELAKRLKELPQRPRLVVLASCQSAGDGLTEEASQGPLNSLTTLGALLANAGVPAVIAMQGKVTMETVEKFMPRFFTELIRDEQIDRAVAAARGEVRDHGDCWMPVLFMRLKSGRIGWYETGLRLDDKEKDDAWWDALISHIEDKQCTPILGPGLQESFVGPAREIARRWGDEHNFPMAPNNRDDLPQVAQYVAITKLTKDVACKELIKHLSQELLKRYENKLPENLRTATGRLSQNEAAQLLSARFSEVGKLLREAEDEPHRVFASLKLPLYISANSDNIMGDALTKQGQNPVVEFCRWNHDLEDLPAKLDQDFEATPEKPLVYHPFGHLSQPDSLVLTLDDYLDYLIGISKDATRTPDTVSAALTKSALLFLGFQVDDWSFRVLFRSIVNQEGSELLKKKKYTHVAVQIDPASDSFKDPESARSYFKTYFGVSDINIYWGSADDFAKDLHARWNSEG